MPDFRIPLAGSYNTRVAATNVIANSSFVVGSGIVGSFIVGGSGTITTKDQRFVNCFTETVVNVYANSKTLYTVKRPGFASSMTPQSGSIGNSIIIWTGSSSKIISAFGATNSSIYDSSTQLVTNNADTTVITGKARSITETVISNVATLAIASTDSTAWFYQPAGTVTKISDAQFPGNNSLTTVGGFAHLDGYPFIMDSLGGIWNGDLNSIINWTITSVVQANSYPDQGVGVFRLGDKIMAMGTESVQFFYNAGNASGSPLSRIEPMTLRMGCLSADAVTNINGVIYWCGSSPEGGVAVHSYGPSGYRMVSTPEINSIILLAGTGNISLSATKFYGRSFVIVQMGATLTFVHCIEENSWHEWSSTYPLWYKCAGVSSGSSQVTYSISNISTSGKVFVINPAAITFQDNGAIFAAVIQTSKLGERNRRTFWEEIEVIGDRQTSTSSITISFSDDDYQTTTELGQVDLADERPRIVGCGSAYSRAWIITHATNTSMRLEALAGRKSVGSA